MRFLGGKMRQAHGIVAAVGDYGFDNYVEPFCGAMWSACAVIKAFPGRRYVLNDANPYLMRFWKAAIYDQWDPPPNVNQKTYDHYKKRHPVDDPMTAYLGFAWPFGGKWFGGLARNSAGDQGTVKGSYASTMRKIEVLRDADVHLKCLDFKDLFIKPGSIVYLDPPYGQGRTPQSRLTSFDREAYYPWAEALSERCTVLATEFVNERGWPVLHNYGHTVVRHLNGKPKDDTEELLMRVQKMGVVDV